MTSRWIRWLARGGALLTLVAAVAWTIAERAPRAGESSSARTATRASDEPVVRALFVQNAPEIKVEIHGQPLVDFHDPSFGIRRYAQKPATLTLRPQGDGLLFGDRRCARVTLVPDDGQPLFVRWTPPGESKEWRIPLTHRVEIYPTFMNDPSSGAGKASARLSAMVRQPMDDFLGIVVASETYADWKREALKAQAVAARTYTLHFMRLRQKAPWDMNVAHGAGDMAWNPNRLRDFGLAAQAARETAGIVMLEREQLFPAYFHAECGGRTTDARVAISSEKDAYLALSGVRCESCERAAASDSLRRSGERTYTLTQIAEALRAKGLLGAEETLRSLSAYDYRIGVKGTPMPAATPNPTDRFARAAFVELHTNAGRRTVLGAQLRMALDYRKTFTSTYLTLSPTTTQSIDHRCVVRTRGSGHGAGMCQWGAQRAAADRGWLYNSILGWYYPGTKLAYVYGGPAHRRVVATP